MAELRLLGPVGIRTDDGREVRAILAQPKRLALLAYLAVATPRGGAARDLLLPLFWPRLDDEHARRALNQAVRFVRRELGEEVIVRRGEDVLVVNDAIRCDVVRLYAAADDGDHATVVELHRGEFLEGLFVADASAEIDEWLAQERARVRAVVGAAQWWLAERHQRGGEPDRALRAARAAVALAPDDERGFRRLVQLLLAIGDRAGAMRAYDAFAARLASEFGVQPSPETMALIASLRAPAHSSVAATRAVAPPYTVTASPAPGMAADAPVASPSGARRRRTRIWATLAGLGWVGIAVAWRAGAIDAIRARLAGRPLASGDTVVLADFANHGGDGALASTVSDAFRIDLEQSRAVRVMPPARVRAALGRMERSTDETLGVDLARELAVREGAKAVVAGEVHVVGSRILLSARVVNAETGELLLARRESARDSSQLLETIDRLSNGVRRQIGESVRTIRASPPLSEVTTASLPALRLYTAAIRALRAGDPKGGFRLLRGAIALDTTFAEAYRTLAAQLGNYPGASRREIVDAMSHAFRQRQHLPAEQQHFVAGNFYWFVAGDPRASTLEYQRAFDIRPTFIPALNNQHAGYMALRDFEGYRRIAVRRLAIDSTSRNARFHDVVSLMTTGRYDSAQRALARLDAFAKPNEESRLPGVRLAFLRRDYVEVRRRAHALQAPGDRFAAAGAAFDAYADAIEGHFDRAVREWELAAARARGEGDLGDALRLTSELAEFIATVRHDTVAARARLETSLRDMPLDSMEAMDRPYARLALAYARIGDVLTARALIERLDALVPASLLGFDGRHEREHARGLVSLGEGRIDASLRHLQAADSGDCSSCVLPDLGRAYLRAGNADSTIDVYDRFLRVPDDDRPPIDALELTSVLKNLGELYESRGNAARARDCYRELVRLRTTADAAPRAEAVTVRARLNRLVRG